jgi:hypothetical protein
MPTPIPVQETALMELGNQGNQLQILFVSHYQKEKQLKRYL